MASVSGAQTSRTLIDILPQFARSKLEVGSIRLKPILGVTSIQSSSSRFPKLEECAHFHYDHVDLPPMQLSVVDEQGCRGEFDGVTLQVTSGKETWQLHRTYAHFCKLDEQLHQCVFDRKFSELPVLKHHSPKSQDETRALLNAYVRRLSAIGSGCAISCGPALTWFELDNRGRRLVAPGNGINTPAVAAAFATTTYTAHATDELSFQTGDMISVIDMPPAEESAWWRGKRGFVVGFFPSNCVAVITDKIPNEIALAGPTKPVLRKHGKLIAFFRAFILSRPSRRRLKQSGILKERVFGCDLSEHLLNTGRDIPLVLKCCAEFIEAHGIVDGIYRLSGVTSNIQRLRSTFDEDRVPILTEDSGIRQDIHSVASLLKMYFRELPNPLCTYQLYDEFVAAVQSPGDKRLENMRKVVQKLPPPHYRTLEYLMGHLGRVCGHSMGTGMTARNVAIVWAPNLLRCKSLDQGVAALQGVGVQAVVTEFLILYAPHIFGSSSQLGDGTKARPKSLAVSTPTKLLPLHEAQVRGQLSPSKSEPKERDIPTSYHTVLELPRKRQTLTWRAIFTPLRSNQTKSSHRIKLKNVVKSAEFLGGLKSVSSIPQGAVPSSSTHSRSVSHDSYFDTVLEQPSTSSLIDTHEGMSLSLDLSELQMNFELEESEMKIFSEDETNQLFSSGTSIAFGALDTESNLEQRFSNQDLRYIDSYSPDPMEPESISEDLLTPGYQPLLTPNSYENLKVATETLNTESGNSSKRSDTSPYAYEKLAESPYLADDMQRKENDLYEPCTDNNNTVNNNIYESMEPEQEMYEPIAVRNDAPFENVYQNEEVANTLKSSADDTNIYEDVQLSPADIYEQVSYLRCSVEQVNRLVEKKETEEESIVRDVEMKPTVSDSMQTEGCGKSEENALYENVAEDGSAMVLDVPCEPIQVDIETEVEACESDDLAQPVSPSKLPRITVDDTVELKESSPLLPKDDVISKSQEIVKLDLDSPVLPPKPLDLPVKQQETSEVPDQYESVNYEDKIYDTFCETEYERVNFSTSAACDKNDQQEENSLEVKECVETKKPKTEKSDCDKLVSDKITVERKKDVGKELSSPKAVQKESARVTKVTDVLKKSEPTTPTKIPCSVVSELLKKDWDEKSRETKASEPKIVGHISRELDSPEKEISKTGKLRMLFEKESHKYDTEPCQKEMSKSDGTKRDDERRTSGESETERRERIEKYKEERRSFFRNKYKTDNINNNDDDDELIKRIKQRAKLKEQREPEAIQEVVLRRRNPERDSEIKRSPSKTTVTIHYSPTRTKLSGDWSSEAQRKTDSCENLDTKSKDVTQLEGNKKKDTSSFKRGYEG